MNFKDCRGNVDTRLAKLEKGEFDAIILASAGIKRLGLSEKITDYFDPSIMIPSVTQGIIAIETRASDKRINEIIETLHCKTTELISICERSFLQVHQATCNTPVACHAVFNGKILMVKGFKANPDGSNAKTFSEGAKVTSKDDAFQLGKLLAEKFLQ